MSDSEVIFQQYLGFMLEKTGEKKSGFLWAKVHDIRLQISKLAKLMQPSTRIAARMIASVFFIGFVSL